MACRRSDPAAGFFLWFGRLGRGGGSGKGPGFLSGTLITRKRVSPQRRDLDWAPAFAGEQGVDAESECFDQLTLTTSFSPANTAPRGKQPPPPRSTSAPPRRRPGSRWETVLTTAALRYGDLSDWAPAFAGVEPIGGWVRIVGYEVAVRTSQRTSSSPPPSGKRQPPLPGGEDRNTAIRKSARVYR